MTILKKLASQTAIYGLSSIVGRFLNYLLVPLYTYYFSAEQYGVVSEFYAYAGFFSVLLLLGFETGYFRFRAQSAEGNDVAYSTALVFVTLVNVAFLAGILSTVQPLAAALQHADHPEYVLWFAVILALDAIAALPFAKLRAENRAFRFAGVKLAEIMITIALSLFFIAYCPWLYRQYPQAPLLYFYRPDIGLGYVFIANLAATGFKFLLLAPQLRGLTWGFDRRLFARMFGYSLPMVVVGFSGIVDEMLDRALLKYLLPHDAQTNLKMLGIYSACYKLSILMSLFIQAFRYAAEPFFFAHADQANARRIYAQVLDYFVLFCVGIFLLVTLFIDVFKYFVGDAFRAGLSVVPVLLIANLFLGVYVNLSIWYKLTDKTWLGAAVALGGALLTAALNVWWIPLYGYHGSAWAKLVCYAAMVSVSYALGQKFYPVAYDVKRVFGYLLLGLAVYGLREVAVDYVGYHPLLLSTGLLLVYGLIAALCERRLWRAHRFV